MLTFLAGPLTVPTGTTSGPVVFAAAPLPSTTPDAANPAVFKKLSLVTLFAIIFTF
jgi:hypothetical protein